MSVSSSGDNPMKAILAIDASAEMCSVALRVGENTWLKKSHEKRSHAGSILPMVDAVFADARAAGVPVAGQQLDAVAYGAGPGSFTGLRIALSVAQGLAFGWERPVIPVCSLMAMAHRVFKESVQASQVLCVLDARMEEFYLALFVRGEMFPSAQLAPELCSYDALFSRLADFNLAQIQAVGLGLRQLSQEQLAQFLNVDAEATPQADAIAELAATGAAPFSSIAPEDAEPVYLRNSVSWNKRQKIRRTDLST